MNNVLLKQCMDNLEESVQLSGRIQKLRSTYFATDPSISHERAVLLTQSYKESEGQPMVLRRAMAVKKILEEMTIYVKEDDLLVGNTAASPRAAEIFPEFSVNWIENELNGDPYFFDKRPGDAYQVTEETKRILLEEVIPYWKGKTHEDYVYSLMTDDIRIGCLEVNATDETWVMVGGDGHTIPNYIKVINVGLKQMIEDAKKKLESLDTSDPDELRKIPFLKAVIMVDQAVLDYAARYAKMLKEYAVKESNPQRKKELEKMAEICLRVPAEPARTFHEAVQSLLFVNTVVQIESNGHSISYGRGDQYLYKFFVEDIEKGILDVPKAFDILCSLWIKANDISKLRDWPNTVTFVGNPLFQNMTLGGQTKEGLDAVNELSYLMLSCTKKLQMIQPSVTVRVFHGTPRRFIRECVKVIRKVGSMPAFFNDDIIIPSMLKIGYSYDDAIEYGMVGCVEQAPHGKIGGRYGAGFPNFAKWVELAINGGKDPITGHNPCPLDKDLTTFENFDELMAGYKKQLEYYLSLHTKIANIVDISWQHCTPNPFLSSVIEGCVERGLEIKEGGAKYDFTGGQNVGTVSAANALATIKKVIYDDKILTPEQLMHALATNFEDMTTQPSGEAIRQILLNCDNKFGNDIDEPDLIAADLMKYFADLEKNYKNTRYGKGPIGGYFVPSTATVSANVGAGSHIGATADGRKAFEPITEGSSAFRGTDRKGPTALLNSYAKLPHVLMPGGQLFNVKLTPSAVDSDEGLESWVDLVVAMITKKCMQIQFNVVSVETLRDAQVVPENYKDLIVRVAGFSSYFVTLCPEVQEDIIARTEHRF